EHGRLVAGARADLQHLFLPRQPEQRRHERHDVRLRDRLPLADRQRMVLVGAVGESLLDEPVPRDAPHGVEHASVGDPAALELLVHHALALARQARLEARLHSPPPALPRLPPRRRLCGPAGTLTLSSVIGGSPLTSTRIATCRATRAAASSSSPSTSEIAIDGTPSSVPSMAADTVPEYVTSSPRLEPWLMPDTTSTGRL